MKIRAIETHIVDAFRANYVFVRVLTDEGVYGVGEATVEHRELTVASAIDELARYLVGKDPFAIDHHVDVMNRDSYWRTGVILRSALSAVELALQDLKGKVLGVSAADLLGGRGRDRIRCYANGWFVGARTPEAFAEAATRTLSWGFTGLKWDPFGVASLDLDGPSRTLALDTIAAVRDAVGPQVELMIEGHGRFNVPTAIAFARDMAPYRPHWFEEPVPPENIDALAQVRRQSPVPIAAGERLYEPARFAELIAKGAADVLQPDITHVGGLGTAKLIAGLAHTHALPIAPHNPLGPIGNAASLQLAAAVPNLTWLEMMVSDVPWRRDLVDEDLELVAGDMLIGDKPGLGLDLDCDACARHPYAPYDLRHYRGDLTSIRPPDATPFYRIVTAD